MDLYNEPTPIAAKIARLDIIEVHQHELRRARKRAERAMWVATLRRARWWVFGAGVACGFIIGGGLAALWFMWR